MWGMFAGASAFDQPLSFDTSRVTTMNALLLEAKAVNPPLSFDTSRVTEMGSQDVRLRDEVQPAAQLRHVPRHAHGRQDVRGRSVPVCSQQVAHPLRVGRHVGLRLCWLWLELGSGKLRCAVARRMSAKAQDVTSGEGVQLGKKAELAATNPDPTQKQPSQRPAGPGREGGVLEC
jgi:hypothetical protein